MLSRRSYLVAFTLTETLALLFFIVALALTQEAMKRGEAEQAAKEHRALAEALAPLGPDGVEALVRAVRQGQDEFPSDFRELTRVLEGQGDARERLRARLAEAGLDTAFVDTASLRQLVDTAAALLASATRELEALAAALPRDGSGDALRNLAGTIAGLERQNTDLRNQVAYMQRQVGTGLDHPPCWADASGRPEYALRVTLRDGRVDVAPVWPPHRAADAERVDGLHAAPGADLTLDEFRRRALPVFRWSRRQDPECRHYVVILDRVGSGKETFKEELLTVERFFYKYLAD